VVIDIHPAQSGTLHVALNSARQMVHTAKDLHTCLFGCLCVDS